MFVKSLKLQNWRSHLKTEFVFGKINLVRGPNNSGKSSLANALEYVLTGRMDGTDERGAGADRHVTIGAKAKEAVLEAQIGVNKSLQVTLRRTRSRSGTDVTATDGGFAIAGKLVEEYFEERGFPRDLLSAALRVGRFLSLDANGQRELIADLVAPPLIEVPADIREALMRTSGASPEKLTLESIRALEDIATKARAACTGALRELGTPEEVKPRDPESPSPAQCVKRLDALRAEQNTVAGEKERRLNAWRRKVEAQTAAKNSLPSITEAILDKPEEEALLEKIGREREINQALETLSRLRFEISELESQIKLTEKKAGKCPTCGHEVEAEDLITRFKEGISARQSRIPTLEGIVGPGEPVHVAREKLRAHREAVTASDRAKATILDDPGPEPDVSDLDAKIKDLEDRMKKGQTILTATAAHEQSFAQYQETIARRAELEAKREANDKIAKWAGPGGAPSQVTSSDKAGAFKSELNEVLHKLGYDLQMTDDAGFMIVGEFPIGTQRPIAVLSESEKWRFSVALQIAIAKVTRIGLVVLDRADVLAGENRFRLMEAVAEAGIEQVFIFASTDEKLKSVPEWLTVFELRVDKDGHTQIEGNQ